MIKACLTCLLLCLGSPLVAQTIRFEEVPDARSAGEIPLPSAPEGIDDREQWMTQGDLLNVRNVTRPTLLPIVPDENPSGTAVIIAPGGAFLGLAIDHEGWQVARWLADRGIAAFVLKYRTAATPSDHDTFVLALEAAMRGEAAGISPPDDTPDEALSDGLAALRYVRKHAAEFGIDPERIGFMGFSAGGFLTRSVVSKGGPDRPDFAAPIYPNMAPMAVPADPPPMFVLIAADDFLLKHSPGLPLIHDYLDAGGRLEFHLLANGGHGFGLAQKTDGMATENWIELFYRWMRSIGTLEARDQ